MEDNLDETAKETAEDILPTEATINAKDNAQSVDESYIHVFLLKYVCPTPDCGGTLAPLPGTDKLQCNMCSRIRSEQEFMEEMQQYC